MRRLRLSLIASCFLLAVCFVPGEITTHANAQATRPPEAGAQPPAAQQQSPPSSASEPAQKQSPVQSYTLTPEKYQKAVAYSRAQYRLYFIEFVYGLLVLLLVLRWKLGAPVPRLGGEGYVHPIPSSGDFRSDFLIDHRCPRPAHGTLRPLALLEIRHLRAKLAVVVLGLDERRVAQLFAGHLIDLDLVLGHPAQSAPLVVLFLAGYFAHCGVFDFHRAAGDQSPIQQV